MKNLILIILFLVPYPLISFAGEPTDSIKGVTDRLVAIVSDASLKAPELKSKREQMIIDAVDAIFSWEEFSKRALARNWTKRTPEEKREFISLFRQLIADTYMGKTYQYSGESITYLDEKIKGDYGTVISVFNTSKGTRIPVEYHMIKKGASWMVYDLHIEGVSLVGNYRSQFDSIISRSSYDILVQSLRQKLTKDDYYFPNGTSNDKD